MIEHNNIELKSIQSLQPYNANARTHSKRQINQIANSIQEFGFTNPVLISDDGQIIAGHGRVLAAKELGIEKVPTLRLSHLSPEQRRAYVIADNKLALNAGWDFEILSLELQALIDLDFNVELTGFSLAEIDLTIEAGQSNTNDLDDEAELIPEPSKTAVSQLGDYWQLGPHRLLCGDAQQIKDIERLMDGDEANLIFTDPPYNVPVDGHVCGLGAIKHREFAFASGEMSQAQFTQFLCTTLSNASAVAKGGAIAFVCMDW